MDRSDTQLRRHVSDIVVAILFVAVVLIVGTPALTESRKRSAGDEKKAATVAQEEKKERKEKEKEGKQERKRDELVPAFGSVTATAATTSPSTTTPTTTATSTTTTTTTAATTSTTTGAMTPPTSVASGSTTATSEPAPTVTTVASAPTTTAATIGTVTTTSTSVTTTTATVALAEPVPASSGTTTTTTTAAASPAPITTTQTTTTDTVASTTSASQLPSEATIGAEAIATIVGSGYVSIPVGERPTDATQVTARLTMRFTLSSGAAQVTLPAGTVFRRTDGGSINLDRLTMRDGRREVVNASGPVLTAVQFGIADVSLSFDRPIVIAMPVGSQHDGQALDVFRSATADFRSAIDPIATCTVIQGTCTFTTATASYFIVGEHPTWSLWDAVPPSPPSTVTVRATADAVTFAWTDPRDADLETIEVLRNIPPSTAVSGTPLTRVQRGVQAYTDRSVEAGGTYIFVLRARDVSGNTASTSAIIVTIPRIKDFETSVVLDHATDDRFLFTLSRFFQARVPPTELLRVFDRFAPSIVFAVYGNDWSTMIDSILSMLNER